MRATLKLNLRNAFALQAGRTIGVVGVLVLAVFITGIVPGAIKHASAYSVPHQCGNLVSGTTTTCTLTVTGAGDLVVVAFEAHDNGPITAPFVMGITGTLGEFYTLGNSGQVTSPPGTCTAACWDAEVWYSNVLTTSGGSDTVTVTSGDSSNTGSTEIYDIVGPPAIVNGCQASQAYSSSAVTSFPTTTSCSFDPGELPVSSLVNACSNGHSLSQGSGFTAFVQGGSLWGGSEYGTPASPPTSPTNFGWTCNIGISTWVNAAIVIGQQAQFTKYVIIPCTAFQLQCWLYPMFVFGIYMVLIIGAARIAGSPTRDYTGHLLEAFSIAGLVCVIFGILNIVFPIIITAVAVIRAARS